jgi:hypothetical protein
MFRVRWGEMESNFDVIRIYNNDGELKSECGGFPAEGFGISVNEIRIDTVSVDPIKFNIYAEWDEYEVDDSSGEMPERGKLIRKNQTEYTFTVDQYLNCSLRKKTQ